MILLTANIPVSKAEAVHWLIAGEVLFFFFFYPAYCARLRLEFNQAPGGGAGWAGALVWWFHGYEHGKWQMESTGEVFHLPITITWRADTCLFEIPDRLIAVFHTADRFNSLLCSFWQCTCIITHYTNKAEKRWPEKSFLICNEGNIFTA